MKTNLAAAITKAREAVAKQARTNGQQELLRRLRDAFGASNEELADALGVSPDTLKSYLSPDGAAKHRALPELDRQAIRTILAKRGRK